MDKNFPAGCVGLLVLVLCTIGLLAVVVAWNNASVPVPSESTTVCPDPRFC